MREVVEAYLKNAFLHKPHPGRPADQLPNEDEWNRIPREFLDFQIDLIIEFNGAGNPALNEIIAEYRKKSHSDTSFGMEVKQILHKHKIK